MKKNISALLAFSLCLLMTPQMQVGASDVETPPMASTTESDISLLTEGLIKGCSVSCSGGTRVLYLSAVTEGFDVMGKIGFTDIQVQRSSNNRDWTTEVNIDSMLTDDDIMYSVNRYPISVQGGYYYRVVLNHYAKEQTWFFPDTQYESNTSSSVWVAA